MNTVKLAFNSFGEADEPLLILHGLFGSGRNWQRVAQTLSSRFNVITVDLRNHGASPHDSDMNYRAMAQDVTALLDQLKLQTVHMIGHSMGGKVAMQMAFQSPKRLKKLVVVDIAPVEYHHEFNDVLAGLHHIPLEAIKSRADADRYLAEKLSEISLRQFLLQNLVKTSEGQYSWRVNLKAIENNMNNIMGFDRTQTSACPVESLFIRGAKSTYLAARYFDQTRVLFPHAEIQTIKDAGHWPHIEKPDAFLQAINDFF